jgi:hypothetical protein
VSITGTFLAAVVVVVVELVVVVVVYGTNVIEAENEVHGSIVGEGVFVGLTVGVFVGVIDGVGGTSHSKYATKSKTAHGSVVVVVVTQVPLVKYSSHKSGQIDSDGYGPAKTQLSVTALKHHCGCDVVL